jgi:serine/threonine protein kinase
VSGEIGLRYQIWERIGAGGMGVVYNALDTRLDRTVAVKTLPHIGNRKHPVSVPLGGARRRQAAPSQYRRR